MLPEPLHPAVVHFPLVLVFLLPLFAAGALWVIRRGRSFRLAWALPVALAAALFVSSFVALRTGQDEQERVEAVVPESAVGTHEEAAERFVILGGVLLVLAAVGLAGGRLGTSARVLTTVGSVALIVAAVQVGSAGGALVYEHGAAGAYVGGQPPRGVPDAAEPGEAGGENAEGRAGGAAEAFSAR